MMCYRDQSYCSDSDICITRASQCTRILTIDETSRAKSLGLPIAWMSFKDTCGQYKEPSWLPLTK